MNPTLNSLCIVVVLFALMSTFGKSMLKISIYLWLQGLFVTALLFSQGSEYLGLVTLIITTLVTILISSMTGTLRGDLRTEQFSNKLKKQSIVRFVGGLIALASIVLIYYFTQKVAGKSEINSIIGVSEIGHEIVAKYKPIAVMIGMLVLTALVSTSFIIHVTDRETI